MFHQTQLLLPDHADEPALLAEIARWVTPDAWLVTYNGRGFDWPLIEARYRLAGRPAPAHAGHLDLLPFVRRVFRHRMENARLRTVEEELLGVSRVGDVEGWEIPQIYLEVLRGGPIGPLAGVVIHNEKDVRSLGLLLAHVEHRYADRATRHEAPRGDLAGLARAYARDRRHDEALECLDDALAAAPPVRDPFGRTAVAPAVAREASHEERDEWWSPRVRPHFGGRAPGAGWRGELANGRGGPLGPSPSAAAWDTPSDRWTDERLAAERARTLRRLGRWAEAAEAWQAAAAAGGGLGAIAWIEVAKLREHRLDDPGGALAATRAAWRLLERLRVDRPGAPAPRGGPAAARDTAGRPDPPPSGSPRPTGPVPSVRVVAAVHALDGVREVRDPEDARPLEDQRSAGRPEAQVRVRAVPAGGDGRIHPGREDGGTGTCPRHRPGPRTSGSGCCASGGRRARRGAPPPCRPCRRARRP